jgi:hypothetical protein
VTESPQLTTAVSRPSNFVFDEVRPLPRVTGLPTPPPPLGALAAFTGDWTGSGFNTIFRPHQPGTPSDLPTPVDGSDNILELNLTSETLSFSASLGSVPNRGEVEGDIFLNGIPYLQSIQDVTVPSKPVGIHLEPGLWMSVPSTTDPSEPASLVRMASIPHGTTIAAQGTSATFVGAPTIPSAPITPRFSTTTGSPFTFPSQTASDTGTARIPQDLTGTGITQAMLDDPNSVLRDHNSSLTITGGTVITVRTNPTAPLFGGGTDNIAFLLGSEAAAAAPQNPGQNALTLQLTATFWIETVEHTINLPIIDPVRPIGPISPESAVAAHLTPSFVLRPPVPVTEPRTITVTSTQIQYSQTVILNFNGLTWPHVSVATLIPHSPISPGW